ncbi:Clavaminate synthase-like protein [Laetiporus sulphureus 93-53]|uniref:Clavaminate synthase-like protein n=1 Tax=Laetiporus sulphureus 93-53 TaxID=1314785 RepID=A0A165EZQ5_9APHY|nr:Clavaminate synthase-like protein [Laetiporus sulphureus 93-53]KZT08059.1 Clavaminate synthase-like protein [Laetiporus sulphureus 93-53]
MPATTLPFVPHYVPAPKTNEPLEYADLPIIDLSKADTPEGRMALAQEVRQAMTAHGFFYVINHGYTQAETDRMFDIADIPFSMVSDDEKRAYDSRVKQTGSYQGYKLRQYWHIDAGVRDQIEHYNINRDVNRKEHPKALLPFLPEIDRFARFNHFNVLHPILRLLALGLELPEETFVNQHNFSAEGETWVRMMKYYPRSEEEERKTRSVWLKGHTDFGSITILWSQPVAALQMQSSDGKWRWIKHIDNALVINAGDVMEFLSGGFYKATIHRVVQPPEHQCGYPRLGLFYFAMPDDDMRLLPHVESPMLQKCGVKRRFEDADAPLMETWRKGRASAYGQTKLQKKDDKVEEEVITGIVVKHFN